ncbi:hypothetical protein F2P81_012785 [Scophthalmus maximus]|uniref:Uncharacterized protein n=1 Tax=Scophthalmus maximus TaxID=52904 RepID=A0A6A4SP51_SCOMX|nr:hypothetical protein F2P81_012785 [Scophthalmus maximus]
MLREGPRCGTGMQSVGQSSAAIHPATKHVSPSTKQTVHSPFLASTGIRTAVTGLQMEKRVESNCGCRHIVAAIFLPSACGYPA